MLLAYTNRFLAIANLIRSLHDKYVDEQDGLVLGQIKLLSKRLFLIRTMQTAGVASLFLCVLCMFLLFEELFYAGKMVFGAALVLLLISLGLSVYEIFVSSNALKLQLKDIEEDLKE